MTQVEAAFLCLILVCIGMILATISIILGKIMMHLAQIAAWVAGKSYVDSILEDRR